MEMPFNYFVLNSIVVFLLINLSLVIFFVSKKITMLNKKIKVYQGYDNNVQTLNDDIRCFKHDFNNIVTTLGGFIACNDMEGLKTFYKTLRRECNNMNNLDVLNPKIFNDPRYL